MAGRNNFNAVKRAVLRCLDHYPDVLAAYIFGSVAKARARRGSDVDRQCHPRQNRAHPALRRQAEGHCPHTQQTDFEDFIRVVTGLL